ncbi:MAG TPA: Rieske 2Fe-2S domain-containing protein [Actinomycetota bacterium]|nr:Rieske 2Fe-2S domain-containing protein [Actinomycetota bacterium]
MVLEAAMKRLEEAEALDEPADKLAKVVGPAVQPRLVKNALSGTWLGHRFHPLLVPLPIGFWTGALLFDLLATRRARWAADVLVGSGIAVAVPTAAAGLSDWADAEPEGRRVGLVHLSCNTLALACYSASLVARLLGRRKAGVGLGLAGAVAISAGGYLGGHLSYVQAVGVEKRRFADGPTTWTAVLDTADLEEGQPRVVRAGDTDVLLYREGSRVHALWARCTHELGPLAEGTFADGCVTCPWHGSTFRLADGKVVRGPAAASQPVYEARVTDGKVEVRAVP